MLFRSGGTFVDEDAPGLTISEALETGPDRIRGVCGAIFLFKEYIPHSLPFYSYIFFLHFLIYLIFIKSQ